MENITFYLLFMNNDFKNLYEVTKTVRFELKPSEEEKFEKGDIKNLVTQFKNIQENFLDIFIYNFSLDELSKEQIKDEIVSKYVNLEFKKDRKIKYQWLRTYTKNEFYEKTSSTSKNYPLSSLEYVSDEFLRWINEWKYLTEKLTEFTDTEEDNKERRSEIAFILRSFLKRQNFRFIKNFFDSVMDLPKNKAKEDDEKIKVMRKEFREIEKNLKDCEKKYLSAQSGGVRLYKASLNYYTLNKTPKEYEDLKTRKEDIIYNPLSKEIFQGGVNKISLFYRDEKNKKISLCVLDNDFLQEINADADIINSNSLDNLYFELKNWKAKQKSDFNEAVAGDKLSVANFREKFPLFDTSDKNFEKFYKLTKELDSLDGNNAKEKAQERGSFFNKPREEIQTKNYYEFCELFKRVAMKRGKIIAEIKGIENEEVQSQMLDHWSVIAEEGDKKSVVIIPRQNGGKLDNHKKAHKFLEKFEIKKREKQKDDITLYHFKSLTLRALEKLCFKREKNTFESEIRDELEEQKNYKLVPIYKEDWRKQPRKLITFYQDVLQTTYVKKNLDLVDFRGLKEFLNRTDITDLQEFESELEKVCYVKVPLYFLKNRFNTFIQDYDAKVFEITTRSISTESKRKANQHAEYWNNFWSDENEEKNYITRLNPEMSVFYREEIKDKSNALRKNGKTEINNRYSKPRFTLATTVTLNATTEKTHLEFKTTDDIKNHVDRFNEKFKENFDGQWVYGIDRGLNELATLNVVKFSNEKNKFGVSEQKEFAKIPVYKLKDETEVLKKEDDSDWLNAKGEKRKIIDNISEVLKEGIEPDSELFKKDIVSSIDLTQAKLIKGHIILNGDKKTYLKLKELSAKRRIFELISSSKIDKNLKFSEKKPWSIDGKKVYFPLEFQTQDQWKGERKNLQEEFDKYLNYVVENLRNEELEQSAKIEKINHLRDAITANMVGILFHLQTILEMPGFIGLENMDIVMKYHKDKIIDEHFEQSNQNISRRLEWSLFRKFANIGNVPPQIKQSVFLRDDFKFYQFGILKFVKIGGTSSNCPNCGKRSGKTNGHFVCKYENDCEFDSQENITLLEKNLHNSDEVAAYNVAKNAFDNIYE